MLALKFGFNALRPGQKEAIETALNGYHSLVMLPTGTGKSLCYQLPSYLMKGNNACYFSLTFFNGRSS